MHTDGRLGPDVLERSCMLTQAFAVIEQAKDYHRKKTKT